MKKMRKAGMPRPKRKRRQKTERERLMLSENKRRRHEMRKRRKQKGQPSIYTVGDEEFNTPNREAMFKKRRKA